MLRSVFRLAAPIAALCSLTACSSDGSMPGALTTSAINSKQAAKPKASAACIALGAKIDNLRQDGITQRVEKASVGKTKTVAVYRTSLARMAELDTSNAEFRQKCSKVPPKAVKQVKLPTPAKAPAAKKVSTTAKKSVKPAVAKKAATNATTTTVNKTVKTVAKSATKTTAPTATTPVTAATKTVPKAVADAAAKKAAEKAKEAATAAAVSAATSSTTTGTEFPSSFPSGQP